MVLATLYQKLGSDCKLGQQLAVKIKIKLTTTKKVKQEQGI